MYAGGEYNDRQRTGAHGKGAEAALPTKPVPRGIHREAAGGEGTLPTPWHTEQSRLKKYRSTIDNLSLA